MNILVVLEHESDTVRPASLAACGFAQSIADSTGGGANALVLGHQVERVAQEASAYAPVLVADDESLVHPLADRYAKIIADAVQRLGVDLVVAASTTWSKDIVARAAGLLGGAMASDVVGHEWVDDELQLQRPMFAGTVNATVVLDGSPKIVTVRASAYAPPPPADSPFRVEPIDVDAAALPDGIRFESLDAKSSDRPDVTRGADCRLWRSGAEDLRGFRTAGRRARRRPGAATGSSRALVDAGITPNSLQVGQTGKIIAPDLYVALGISGAVQHLAGMKNSKIVAAVNSDPDAPIFELADFGVVGDVYEIVPELIKKLADA